MFTHAQHPRRSLIPLVTELHFADDPAATTETPASQGGGGGTPAPAQQQPASAVDGAQLKQIVSEAYASGISEQRDRDLAKFQKRGLELVKDKEGKPSLSLTLDSVLEQLAAAKKPAAKPEGADAPNERVQELQAQLELVTKQRVESDRKAAELEQRFQEQIERVELTAAFTGSDLVDGALDDAIDLFLKRYRITKTAEGEVRVKSRQNGQNVLSDQARPANVKEAVKKFLEETPYLRKSSVPTVTLAGGRKIAAGVEQVTREDVARGRVDPKKIMDGTAVVID